MTTTTIITTLKLHMVLQIYADENIDRQNNSVTKELKGSTLKMERVWVPA